MKNNVIIFVILFCPIIAISQASSKSIALKINSDKLKRINYKDKHNSWNNVEKTSNEVIQYAQNLGFLTAYFDTVKKTDRFLELNLKLPQKYKIGHITISDSLLKILKPNIKEKTT